MSISLSGDQVGALVFAEARSGAERLAQLDRERVVVDVDMGDEEVPDVAELVADLPQAAVSRSRAATIAIPASIRSTPLGSVIA